MLSTLFLFVAEVVKYCKDPFRLSPNAEFLWFAVMCKINELPEESICCKSMLQVAIKYCCSVTDQLRLCMGFSIFKCIVCIEQYPSHESDFRRASIVAVIGTHMDTRIVF
ncbi:hypothetical protein D3C73_1224980 [compost metagenome]